MVGRGVTSHYRRDLNFLSRIGYRPLGKIYSEILVRAIVASLRVHIMQAVVRRNKFRHRERSTSNEYRRDGSGRR
jgi:hypothetical protein